MAVGFSGISIEECVEGVFIALPLQLYALLKYLFTPCVHVCVLGNDTNNTGV